MKSDLFSEERLYSNNPIFIYLIAQLVKSFRHYKKIENKISQFCNQFLQFKLPTSSLLLMLYLVLLRRDRTIIRLISSCIRWWKGLQAFFVTTMPKKNTHGNTKNHHPNITTQIQTLIRKQLFWIILHIYPHIIRFFFKDYQQYVFVTVFCRNTQGNSSKKYR